MPYLGEQVGAFQCKRWMFECHDSKGLELVLIVMIVAALGSVFLCDINQRGGDINERGHVLVILVGGEGGRGY